MGFLEPVPQRARPVNFNEYLWRRPADFKFVYLTDDAMVPAVEILRSAARQAGVEEFTATLFGDL